MTAKNPYLFAFGCPRSGTTLLQRMLDAHPLLAVSNDPHFVPFAPGVGVGTDPPLTPALVDWVLAYPTFYRLGLDQDQARKVGRPARTFGEFVAALYDALAAARGKPFAGEKTPRYVRYLPLLYSLFPKARAVHLIRDGRDVALSTLDWARPDRGPGRFRLWRENPLAVCALSWRWHVMTGRRDGRRFGDLYVEVRYEGLVNEPEAALRALCERIGLPFDVRMLTFHLGRIRHDPKLSTKQAWLPPTPGVRDWHTTLSRPELELFEALAGDLLADLGYEPGVDAVSPEVESEALSYREAWETELLEREEASRDDRTAPLVMQR